MGGDERAPKDASILRPSLDAGGAAALPPVPRGERAGAGRPHAVQTALTTLARVVICAAMGLAASYKLLHPEAFAATLVRLPSTGSMPTGGRALLGTLVPMWELCLAAWLVSARARKAAVLTLGTLCAFTLLAARIRGGTRTDAGVHGQRQSARRRHSLRWSSEMRAWPSWPSSSC
jgi:hypothetical protein